MIAYINRIMSSFDSLESPGLVTALRQEGAVIIERLSMTLVEKRPFPVYRAGDIYLAISGVGKVNAALAASHLAEKYGRKSLVNMGTAGALKDGLAVGDTFIISRVTDHDRTRFDTGEPAVLTPELFPGGNMATLVTLDRPVLSPEDRIRISAFGDLVDMEGAGFVQGCRKFSVTPILVKSVTDTAETGSLEDILSNIAAAGEIFHGFFERAIRPLLPQQMPGGRN